MYRLLAIDLDGTLLNPQHTISPHTLHTLQRAVASGMKLVIATGRVPYIFHFLAEQLPLNAPQITSNGAIIIDAHGKEIIHELLLPTHHILPTLEAINKFDLQPCYYTHESLFVEQALYDLHNWYLASAPVAIVDKIINIYPQPCIKLAAFGDASTLREKRRELEQHFAAQLYVTQTAREWLEFMHPTVSKANALKQITQELAIKPEEVIAFGDNHNDIGMLRFAGLGIAMGNAHDEVKAAADYVTSTNAEDGVAVAIEKFLF